MRREARFVQSVRGNRTLHYQWYDKYQYAILREEWMKKHECIPNR